jgi:hypothetical protein
MTLKIRGGLKLGFKSVVLIFAVLACLALQAIAQDSIVDDVKAAFQHEDLFNVSASTGMSPNATAAGVRTPVVAVRTAIVSGSWSLSLRDTISSTMKLDLNQYQDAVFGSGDVTKQGITMPVTAGGTIFGDRLNLYVMTNGSANLYRMSLTTTPAGMSGNYVFTAPGINQPGIAFGSLTAPVQANVPILYNQPILPNTMALGPKNQYLY